MKYSKKSEEQKGAIKCHIVLMRAPSLREVAMCFENAQKQYILVQASLLNLPGKVLFMFSFKIRVFYGTVP